MGASSLPPLAGYLAEVLGEVQAPLALHEPFFGGREKQYVTDCIETGWVSSLGSYVDRFEAELARRCGTAHAVAAVSGTAALHIALMLAGVSAGDEVLMPSLTFIATANAAAYCGAVPHFVDCEARTMGIDPAALSARLAQIGDRRGDGLYNKETGRRIAALVPVHIFGHPCDMDALGAVAGAYDLPVVEDAAEALGSRYRGRPAGSFGRLAALSFNGNKIVTTGGGGAILTDDPVLARRAKHLTTTAKIAHRWEFRHDETGYNYRLPNINAALGCAQLEQLDGFLAAKRRLAARYAAIFEGAPCRFFSACDFAESNYWLNAVFLPEAGMLEGVLEGLHAAGYLCRPAWVPMHCLPMYSACPRAELPVTEDLAARVVNLPSSAALGMAL